MTVAFARPIAPELQARADEIAFLLQAHGVGVIPVIGDTMPWLRLNTAQPIAIQVSTSELWNVWVLGDSEMPTENLIPGLEAFKDYNLHHAVPDDEAYLILTLGIADGGADTAPAPAARPWGRGLLGGLLVVLIIVNLIATISLLAQNRSLSMELAALKQSASCRHAGPNAMFYRESEVVVTECGGGSTFLVQAWGPNGAYENRVVKLGEPFTILGMPLTVMDCSSGMKMDNMICSKPQQ